LGNFSGKLFGKLFRHIAPFPHPIPIGVT
jgi:hypothetical protein